MSEIIKKLYSFQDTKYKEFHQKLIPNIEAEKVIGVKTPVLRKFAKEIPDSLKNEFLRNLPHKYYEENNLHAFLICEIKDVNRCFEELERFLPFIDNWAICDSLRPKIFKKNKKLLLEHIDRWLKSEHTYTVRFAIECLMTYFFENFKIEYSERVALIKREEYYINMMMAWYFATALSKRWEENIGYLTENKLSDFVHNKTIQKAIESFRITDSQKEYLKTLKRKQK